MEELIAPALMLMAVIMLMCIAMLTLYVFNATCSENLQIPSLMHLTTHPVVAKSYDSLEILRLIADCKMCVNGNEIKEMAARVCKDYLNGEWKNITSKTIILKRISGGLSNWLFHVSLPETHSPEVTEPSQVLLRLYGETHGTESALEGLITESVIFTLLSERKLGPKLHGIFPGGRIEEYIPARPLKTRELSDPKLSTLIAQKMANIHQMNIPINKEPHWLWNTIDGWLQNVQAHLEDINTAGTDNAKFITILKDFKLKEELVWLKSHVNKINSPVVFCHNDMQEGNILLYCNNMTEEEAMMEPQLVLIDFEYCSYNYRGFDIANHFIEWIYDYTCSEHPYYTAEKQNYPTLEQQLVFIKEYIRSTAEQDADLSEEIEVENEEIESLLREVEAFTLVSHFFWGLWSAVNARVSQIPFGYWEYAVERLQTYFQLKEMAEEKGSLASILCQMGTARNNDVKS